MLLCILVMLWALYLGNFETLFIIPNESVLVKRSEQIEMVSHVGNLLLNVEIDTHFFYAYQIILILSHLTEHFLLRNLVTSKLFIEES